MRRWISPLAVTVVAFGAYSAVASGAEVARTAAVQSASAQEQPATAPQQPAWSWPDNPQNLQVLSLSHGGGELRATMIGFVGALGVRCSHCHVGSGNDLSTYDFASDANERKRTARVMMRMTQAINADYLAEVAGQGQARATCFTCHRGSTRPLTSPPEEG